MSSDKNVLRGMSLLSAFDAELTAEIDSNRCAQTAAILRDAARDLDKHHRRLSALWVAIVRAKKSEAA